MESSPHNPIAHGSSLGWITVALAGIFGPALAILTFASGGQTPPIAALIGPVLAVGLMGAGMIAAAVAGRFLIGIALALGAGASLTLLASAMGMEALLFPLATATAVIIASFSFAARGALFAKSAGARGWWIALFVVGGEAAILATAAAQPEALPDWLLVLLPAQWANIAIQNAIIGNGVLAASSALIALAGTAAATLFVAALLPKRWPYIVMFTTWIGLSALVWHHPAPPIPSGAVALLPAQ